jgi:hypothetical protein
VKRRKQAKKNNEPVPATIPAAGGAKKEGIWCFGGPNGRNETTEKTTKRAKEEETYRGERAYAKLEAAQQRRSDLQTFIAFFVIDIFT